jgi:hypothetical protein
MKLANLTVTHTQILDEPENNFAGTNALAYSFLRNSDEEDKKVYNICPRSPTAAANSATAVRSIQFDFCHTLGPMV